MINKIIRKIKYEVKTNRLSLTETFHNTFATSISSEDSDIQELNEINKHAVERSDINEHLNTIFCESLILNPKLIVELGVRNGESTFVFERVAKLCNSKIISVDLDPCATSANWKDWFFVQSDDIAFAKEFPSYCKGKDIDSAIDLLFIDTSHLYDHTVQEIVSWFPLLAKKSKVIFHDTNMGDIYRRNDGSAGIGWDSDRGVIRAIEEHFNTSFNEKHNFKTIKDGFLITHYANCSGCTILERIDDSLIS